MYFSIPSEGDVVLLDWGVSGHYLGHVLKNNKVMSTITSLEQVGCLSNRKDLPKGKLAT